MSYYSLKKVTRAVLSNRGLRKTTMGDCVDESMDYGGGLRHRYDKSD